MRFRNSVRLLMDNFKNVYKLLFSKMIIGLVAVALCCSFVLPELLSIWRSEEVQLLVSQGKEFFTALFAANAPKIEELKGLIFGDGGSLKGVTALLSSMTLEIVLTLVGVALVYILRRFAETVCHFTTGSMLNDKMATYAETKFSTAFVANLGKASKYSAVYVPAVFLFDALTILLVWGILSLLPVLTALFFSVTAIAMLQALKLTVASSWLPAMTTGEKGLREALRGEKGGQKQRGKVYSLYLVSVYLIIIVNAVAALFTFGSALLITVPASYFFLICVQYVNYYTLQGKKYFLTYKNIATNPDHGDVEHFFDYIGATNAEEEDAAENTQPNDLK